ncbi:MAG: hypothetical protein LH475_04845 [Cryobacterium sp.]|uniref:hypothetical protein n=1 Tax=unclassified Cryobacterium TaxID=2649013 RepID=UPI0018CA1881|nr:MULTISPECIES: hypothetical protein [unclassified Cryobacterium]MCY7403947.1 hypothetical protein [Cryobacterium sp.]MEC5155320.1 hypothetical protein [Cryobacterium sp. CAN_C3]
MTGVVVVSRALILVVATFFSGYHVLLGVYSLNEPHSSVPILMAMGLYIVATVASLWPSSPMRMALPLALFNVAVAVAIPLIVGSQLDGSSGNLGYETWYVAAIGTLMTITATRKRLQLALLGVGALVVHSVLWAGVGELGNMGVIGSVVWVVAAGLLSRALVKASRDARQYSRAEREASGWHAAQEAHLYERQVRLTQTMRLAMPMLRRISESNGQLTEAERRECRLLEAAIRDEIRGRRLLNDAVREQVMAARRRGASVTLLDEGGIDDLNGADLAIVLNTLAIAIGRTSADKIIARTSADSATIAVTVVGLSSPDPAVSALGPDSSGEEVDLWMEIPRQGAPVA